MSNSQQPAATLFALLRTATTGEPWEAELTDEEWTALHRMAGQQALVGVLWTAVTGRPMPAELALRWASEAEAIRGMNALQNEEAARLTRLLDEAGRRSAVLKGQANARLYPDPLSRQPGDIDIWVDGGRERVVELLLSLGLLDKRPTIADVGRRDKATVSYHHVHLPPTAQGVEVEVHFLPSSGNWNPATDRRLQRWLEETIDPQPDAVSGFCVPSTRFALMMQLAHVQRHFLSGGIGLRQICDYYWLLHTSTSEDRRQVSARLGSFGLRHTAGALMWVLGEVLHLDESLMLCERDSYRGEWMLSEVTAGGNFGHYAQRMQQGRWRRFFASKRRHLELMRFDFWEMAWCEVKYWKSITLTLPERIRRRSWSLAGSGQKDKKKR